jgi:ActR/RegA family two-component response regulator
VTHDLETTKGGPPSRRLHLLVADDEGSHRDQLQRTLQQLDCVVAVVSRHETAVMQLASASFDVMVVEPNLPEGSWLRLLRSLRAAAPAIPLLVVTAFFSRAMAAEAADLGAIAVLCKPINGSHIVGLLRGEIAACSVLRPADLSLAHVEWEHINGVLRRCDGNMARAARCLGITRQSLYNKLRKAPQVIRDCRVHRSERPVRSSA